MKQIESERGLSRDINKHNLQIYFALCCCWFSEFSSEKDKKYTAGVCIPYAACVVSMVVRTSFVDMYSLCVFQNAHLVSVCLNCVGCHGYLTKLLPILMMYSLSISSKMYFKRYLIGVCNVHLVASNPMGLKRLCDF